MWGLFLKWGGLNSSRNYGLISDVLISDGRWMVPLLTYDSWRKTKSHEKKDSLIFQWCVELDLLDVKVNVFFSNWREAVFLIIFGWVKWVEIREIMSLTCLFQFDIFYFSHFLEELKACREAPYLAGQAFINKVL